MSAETTFGSDGAGAALAAATERLSTRAEAVLVRDPVIDTDAPDTSDIDLLALGTAEDYLPERIEIPGLRRIDVMWLARGELADLGTLAAKGLIPHRILSSRILFDRTGVLTRQRDALARMFPEPKIRATRISGLLEMGYATVREIGVSWDAPEIAFFWLHMAHAACIAALGDGLGQLCPNVYTRPTASLREIDRLLGTAETERMARSLRLDTDPAAMVAPLRNLHTALTQRFPEPDWPDAMREMTRWEYRYFSAPAELDWRIRIAEELAARGDRAGAVFYLRFHAYALARLPLVHARARAGGDENFLRPSQRVGAGFARLCPDLAEDLAGLLTGGTMDRAGVEAALSDLLDFRARILSHLGAAGVILPELPAWEPFHEDAPFRHPEFSNLKETSHACR